MEKITYLVTNYNNAKYVGECLESIVNQTNKNWLCIVIDDCSNDQSLDIIQSFSSDKVKIVRNSANVGQIRSLEKLLDLVRTDIVGIIDSDDAIHHETTEYVLRAYKTSSRIGMVYTNCIEYDEELRKPVYIGHSQRLTFGPASSIVFGYVSSLRTFRLSSYRRTEGYNIDLLYAEDLDLMYKLEEVCLPYFVNKYLYKYRRVPNSRSRVESNILIGINNHYFAKSDALNRRKLKGIKQMMCKLYIFSERGYLVNKYKKRNFRKLVSRIVRNISVNIIDKLMYKIIVFK